MQMLYRIKIHKKTKEQKVQSLRGGFVEGQRTSNQLVLPLIKSCTVSSNTIALLLLQVFLRHVPLQCCD